MLKKSCSQARGERAVTRAKKLLILIGSEENINKMVDNNKRTRRYTSLRHMLTGTKKSNSPFEQ